MLNLVVVAAAMFAMIHQSAAFHWRSASSSLIPRMINQSVWKAADYPLAHTFSHSGDIMRMLDALLVNPIHSALVPHDMRMDVKETPDTFELAIDVPGVDKKDINISVEEKELVISAERETVKKEESENFRKIERRSGVMYRTLILPDNVDTDSIAAELKDGVLHLNIHKVEPEKVEKKGRKIEVK